MSFDSSLIPDYMLHNAVQEALGNEKLSGGNGTTPYNFRCPICGDSKKNKNLKRGYVLYNRGEWVYVCHNECGTMSFLNFLRDYHNDIYKDIIIQGYANKGKWEPKKIIKSEFEKTYLPIGELPFKKDELVSIFDPHPLAQQALNWVISRQIREQTYENWYVCLEGAEFYDKDGNGNLLYNENGFPKGNEYKKRLIIPYYRFGGKWTQFDARALDPMAVIRYKNLKNAEREPYNIDWLDVTKPFFLLEGCINSTFIYNSVAFGGTKHFNSLLEKYPYIREYSHNGTVIWDNDDAGYDMISHSIDHGFNWFNWSTIKPSDDFKLKSDGTLRVINDINDLVMFTEIGIRDENNYIKYESLYPYIEPAKGGKIKASLLYGDREAIRKEKNRKIFMEMNEKRKNREKIVFYWEK